MLVGTIDKNNNKFLYRIDGWSSSEDAAINLLITDFCGTTWTSTFTKNELLRSFANIGLQPTLKKLESLVENAVEENAFDLDITKGVLLYRFQIVEGFECMLRFPPKDSLVQRGAKDNKEDLNFAIALYHEWKQCKTTETKEAQDNVIEDSMDLDADNGLVKTLEKRQPRTEIGQAKVVQMSSKRRKQTNLRRPK